MNMNMRMTFGNTSDDTTTGAVVEIGFLRRLTAEARKITDPQQQMMVLAVVRNAALVSMTALTVPADTGPPPGTVTPILQRRQNQ